MRNAFFFFNSVLPRCHPVPQEGRGGRIINTVSLLGMAAVGCEGSLSWAGYSAANYGNVAYTRIFSAANTFGNDVSGRPMDSGWRKRCS